MGGLGSFLSYNNAVPIAISFMLMGAGGVFAATNPDAIYSSTESVVQVDNTYIANKNLDAWMPRIAIGNVTEDDENYYVAYTLATIDVADAVWQDVTKSVVLAVAKGTLGNHMDLGVYTTEQLKQVVDAELARLKETQKYERRAVSHKTIATEYSGLVGRFLDPTTESLPGYVPIVTPPPSVIATNPIEPGALAEPGGTAQQAQEGAPSSPTPTSVNPAAPVIQILGPNPHTIPLGANFADLGAVATDDSGYIPTIRRFLDGKEVLTDLLTVDTSAPGEWTITYVATDADGNSSEATRRIIVGSGKPVPAPVPAATTTPPESEPPQTAEDDTATSTSD